MYVPTNVRAFASTRETSDEIALAIFQIAKEGDEARMWQEPSDWEKRAVEARAWFFADPDTDKLNWGVERIDRPARKQVRFWVYIGAAEPTMLKLRSGQTLRHTSGGQTEEGYSFEFNEWEFDGERLWCRWQVDARDCDGRLTGSGESWCLAEEVMRGNRDGEDSSVRYPLWHDGKVAQRDYAAEAAGY